MKSILTSAFLLLSCLAAPLASFSAQPNLVIFLADDAGWGDYGQSGKRGQGATL